MDEDAYRAVYKQVNHRRCVFEKALNNRRCDCERKERKLIATREAVGCLGDQELAQCRRFLNMMRHNSRFSLKVVTIEGPLPHNKELQVQAGGCLQLESLLVKQGLLATADNNIFAILTLAIKYYGSIETIPYSEIVRGIVTYKSRPKRKT
ncbi:MAG: hypothetical protein KAH22_03420 [Thiotrichaceae bacterium]|nr:hypothetical protein [Thiotrichaceae bacterium]